MPLLYLSAYLERCRDEYTAHLQALSESGNWHAWTVFFLKGVTEQSRDATARAKRLLDLQQEWRQRVTRARASAMLPKLVDLFFQSPYMTVAHVQEALKLSYQGAQNLLKRMAVQQMVVTRKNRGSAKLYIAEQIVQIVTE